MHFFLHHHCSGFQILQVLCMRPQLLLSFFFFFLFIGLHTPQQE
jgi:hypothetical protein